MSLLRFHTLDVFTDTAFSGNPLAVVLGGDALSPSRMQRIAREFNLSETVFVLPATQPQATLRLRIFTPLQELPFAGHPIIGAACLLSQMALIPHTEEAGIVLEAPVGLVPVTVRRSLDAPLYAELSAASAAQFSNAAPPADDIAAALGLDAAALDAPCIAGVGLPMLLVPLRMPESLAGIDVDYARLRKLLDAAGAHSAYVYAHGYEGSDTHGDLRARMFSPGIGEDPATGSAALALAAHLARNSQTADGTLRWTVQQGAEIGRPSRLDVTAEKRGGQLGALRVGGYAVPIMEGHLHAD